MSSEHFLRIQWAWRSDALPFLHSIRQSRFVFARRSRFGLDTSIDSQVTASTPMTEVAVYDHQMIASVINDCRWVHIRCQLVRGDDIRCHCGCRYQTQRATKHTHIHFAKTWENVVWTQRTYKQNHGQKVSAALHQLKKHSKLCSNYFH